MRASPTSLTVINIRSLFHSEGMPLPQSYSSRARTYYSRTCHPQSRCPPIRRYCKIDTNTIYPSTLTPYGDRHWVDQFENVASNVSERLLDQASHKTSILITTCRRMLVRASAISEGRYYVLDRGHFTYRVSKFLTVSGQLWIVMLLCGSAMGQSGMCKFWRKSSCGSN